MAQLCLKWNNFEASIMQVFQEMFETENLVDVTIGCERTFLKAHKVVLAACSPYFQSLFMSNPCKHPIVILKDVKFQDLKLLVEFMYRGEVTVSHDQLPSLLKTAETLQIKQLAQMTTHPGLESPVNSMARKKRKRPRTKRIGGGVGGVETPASGDSDGESKQLPGNLQTGFQSEHVTGEQENDVAMDGSGDGADGARILELSMAEVVGQNVDADQAEEAARNLDASEISLALPGHSDDYDEERFCQANVGGLVSIISGGSSAGGGQEDAALMLMRKKQSFVWDHFTETGKGSVKCKKCAKLLSYKDTSGSTSNMIKHLKTVHAVERAAKPPLTE